MAELEKKEETVIDYDWILSKELTDAISDYCEAFHKALEDVFESLNELAESVGRVIGELIKTIAIQKPRPKYKFLKSTIKPYTAPVLRVERRARSNLSRR